MVKDSDILDEDDRRVVAALQISPRAGVGGIGRILGEHERTVARRVHRLIAWGAIQPTAVYDTMRCGLGNAVQLRLETECGALEEVARALVRRDDLRRVVAVSGRSDVLWCEMIVAHRPGLHTLIAEGFPEIPRIRKVEVHTTLKTFVTAAEWRVPVLTAEEETALRNCAIRPLPDPADRYELTATDRRVAEELIRNARVSLTDLARELGFSVATAGRRVTSLLERRMLYLRTEVEPELLGRPVQAQMCLKVHPAALETVGVALASSPEVRYCAAITGVQNLIVEVCLEHEADLYRFLSERLGSIPNITDVATEIITHAYKRGFVVKPARRRER
ncbi:Lrp/AsnC family transcriptional regulator [Streptomyces hesseae]|uniref:Lrp/AsnC family transcriptional regulator n=1 Tax=Streptomyces hesseae TaxID=3075519 RepID=A0ABU2ST28_9ACTN|nr:Lrp/AsnC family transcriptional regulator [Streptomyces sp. DSM 40473]MDT0452162.1 Lrp/AsnC family transcriptional regulator [Streptomyces sp. DSM 40473]